MKNKYTLTTFVEDIITNYKLEHTEKNFKKIRIKFERELKRLNLWDNAEKKLIGKKLTRIFRYSDLKRIEIESRDYLLKNSKIDKNEYLKHLDKCDDIIENRFIDESEDNNIDHIYKPFVSNQDKIELMIEALFYKFYDGIDVDLWEKDLRKIEFVDEFDMQDITYFNASNRLNNKFKAYVKNKKD